ncbi:MAG: lysophospholipid acyltransferase family protein [Hyphomicrobiaceae bacterium]
MAVTDARQREPDGACPASWRPPTRREIWRRPLPHLGCADRALARLSSYFALSQFSAIGGLEHVRSSADPFILALNHATRAEALALPPLLVFEREGKLVHFFADWNFQMIPGIGLLYRRSGAIVVTRKSARPAFLNYLKPLFTPSVPVIEQARTLLATGRSLAIFVEGTVNRDPARLLRGRLGAARLSLETAAPVVPAGIAAVTGAAGRRQLALAIGPPLYPDRHRRDGSGGSYSTNDVREWHSKIMCEIARLSGKTWQPSSQENNHETR